MYSFVYDFWGNGLVIMVQFGKYVYLFGEGLLKILYLYVIGCN